MWKYRCKSHLFALVAAFIVGCIITAFSFSSGISVYKEMLPGEVYTFVLNNKVLMCAFGGLSFSGIINVIMLAQFLMSTFSVNPIWFMLLIPLFSYYLVIVGIILVIPAVIVCVYGIISLRMQRGKQMSKRNLSAEDEIVRIYSIHHKLKEEVKPLAQACRKNVDKATFVYLLGVVALACLMFVINSVILFMVAFLVFMFLFNLLLRYRASCMIPITSLLYDKCDPESCASAIIYYSTRNGKIKLKNQTLLAQCLIYLDDPQLAQDVLISYPRKDAASSLTYWSLMSYIYYLLKDEEGLARCKEEAMHIRLGFGQTGVLIQNEELLSIQNKIDLMNGEFSTVKKYYLNSLKKARFAFQQVDACYYIALISFVEEDYPLANLYFEKVINLGNSMSFVEKAKHYQSKMENMNLDIEDYKVL